MLTATVATVTAFFYPVGNTPAKSLTKSIPPKTPADILLLGCGDVRDILFTSHVNSQCLIIQDGIRSSGD